MGPPTAVTSPRTSACDPRSIGPPIATTSPLTGPSIFAPPPMATTSPFTASSVPIVIPPPILTRSELRPEDRRERGPDGAVGAGAASGASGAIGASAVGASAVGAAAAGGAGSNSARCAAASRYESRMIRSASAPRRRLSSAPVTGSPSIAIAPLVNSTDRTPRLVPFGLRTTPPCTGKTSNRCAIGRPSVCRSAALCAPSVIDALDEASSTASRTAFIRPMITPPLNRAVVAASKAPALRAQPDSTGGLTRPVWRARQRRSARWFPPSSRH